MIGAGVSLAAVVLGVAVHAVRSPAPQQVTSASAAASAAAASTTIPSAPDSGGRGQPSSELRAFDAWVESALPIIARKPSPTSKRAPHPVLGLITCHTQPQSPSFGLCTSTRIVQRGGSKSVYSAKWKQDDPSVWTVATTVRHLPSLDCKALAPGPDTTVGRFSDASGTRLHCRVSSTRQALISQYTSAPTHRSTNLVYFSPSFPQYQPGFARLLSPTPTR